MYRDTPENAAEYLNHHFSTFLEELKTLARIPSVSFPGFPKAEVRKSAEAVASLLKRRGLENVEILDLPGAHPYVYADWLKAPGKPTLLLYAHHDVQPPGRMELWKTPPFEPTEKEGPGGPRVFGRGTADDKAGILVHVATIASYLETHGGLPLNVKIVIEGEEEIGSTHLEDFLKTYQEKLKADVLVLTDTANFDVGVPALTVGLRGMVGVEIEVKALSKAIHSGMWGGPLPDPALGLAKVLASLVDEHGQIAIPGVLEQYRRPDSREKAELDRIPYSEEEFRAQCGLLSEVPLLRTDYSPVVQVWRAPSLTVNAIQASSRAQAGNIINDAAWAKVTIRLVPDMDPEKVLKLLTEHLKKNTPWGLSIQLRTESCTPPWSTSAIGPAFEAAEKALERGYGRKVLKIGSGGSIPFVKPFTDALAGAPALLIGVEDPFTNAHGENESVLIDDLRKACLSQIYLFEELSQSITL